MTALDNAILDYRALEGTSTISPYFVFNDHTFHTRASTTLFEEHQLSDEAIDAMGRIKSYLKLEENWDSYGGIPPEKGVVDRAISFVNSLDRRGCLVFFTAPGPNGEILVELKKGNKTIEVTFTEDRNITSAFFIGDRCIEETNTWDESKIFHWLLQKKGLDVEVVTGNDGLLRRITVHPSYIKPDNTISSFAFKPRKIDVDGLSVDLERLTTYEVAIVDRTKFRLARLQASIPMSLGLACVHEPKTDNPAHSLIQGNFSNSICRKLATSASFVI